MTGLGERDARMALTAAVDCGDPVLCSLVELSGAAATWAQVVEGTFGEPMARRAAAVDLVDLKRGAQRAAIRFIVPGDGEWPNRLHDLSFCSPVQRRGGVPIGLWLRGPGHLSSLVERSVAVVGSRACTNYGSGVAADLAADLAQRQLTVVSGGAYGIDAAAHRGALAVHGPTVCVLANGVNVPYPAGNTALFQWIARHHLLVSELPPGANPTRVRFLARNRLIAAISLGTVIVEAALRSGARNTASWALACNRQLMAVPGPVHSTMSAAPHLLIRNGQATLVSNAADVHELTAPMGEQLLPLPRGESRPTDGLDPRRLAVYEAVPAGRGRGAGEIALEAGVAMSSCLAELTALELAGLVQADTDGWRLARLPS